MSYIPDQQINTGSFVETTSIWDPSILYEIDISEDLRKVLVRLYQNLTNISIALNTKETGYHIEEEFVSGKLFFNPLSTDPLQQRPGFIKTINTGSLGAGVTAVDHGIAVTNTFKWMFISGAATDTLNLLGYPITFGGAASNNIEVTTTATQVIINNNSGQLFTDSQVTLEYVKF